MQQCENSYKPRPQQPVAKRPPARRRERGGEGGGAMNSTTVARSELSLCECESAGEQVSERKCVRCRERVCVCVCACTRLSKERERVCAGAGKASAVFLKRKTQPASLLCLSVDYTTTGDSPFGLFRRLRLLPSHLPLKGTPVRVKAKTTDLALVNRATG